MSSSALVRTGTVRSHMRPSVGLPQSRGIRIGRWPSCLHASSQTYTLSRVCLAKHNEVEAQNVFLVWERQPLLSAQWGRKCLHATAYMRAPKRSDDDGPENGSVPSDGAYVIDPITNRKVFTSKGPKKSAQFLGHIAGFAKMAPPNETDPKDVHLDGISPEYKDKSLTTDSEKQKSSLGGIIEDDTASATGSFQNTSFDHDKTTTYVPFHADEPDGKYKVLQSSTSSNSGLEEFDSTHDYNSGVRAHEPDGLYKVLQAKKEKPDGWTEFDEKTAYDRGFRSHEPDGMYKVLQANKERPNGWTEFDEKTAYDRGFRSHEPDGMYKKMQSEIPVVPGLSDHDSKIAYEAFRAHEPDGKYKEMQAKMPVVPGLSDHDSKIAYEAFRAYEPDGKYKALQKQTTKRSKDGLGEVDAKFNYQTPYKSHEPDGKYKASQKNEPDRSGLDQYEEKQDYGKPVRAHEPDGMYKPLHISAADRKGLNEYEVGQDYSKAVKAHEPNGMYKHLQTSEASRKGLEEFEKKHPGYDKPIRAHEPDGMYKPLQASRSSQDALDYDREHNYKEGVRAHEPDGMYKPLQASKAARKGLDEFEKKHPGYDKPVRAHEPDGMYKPTQEKASTVDQSDFDVKNSYGPVFSDEPDGKYKKNQYVTFQSQDPNGKPMDKSKPAVKTTRSWLDQEGFSEQSGLGRGTRVPSIPQKFGVTHDTSLSRFGFRIAYRSKFSKFGLDDADKTEDLDLLRASDVRARSGILKKGARKESDAEKAAKRQALTADFESTTSMDGVTSDRPNGIRSIESDSNSVEPGEKSSQRKVTGNFVQDFPEEFSISWISKPDGALVPNTEGTGDDSISETPAPNLQSQEQESDRKVLTNDPNSRSGSSSRMQSSMDRQQTGSANSTSDQSDKSSAAPAKPLSKTQQHSETLCNEEFGQQGEGDLSVFVSSCARDKNSVAMLAERRAKLEAKREHSDMVSKLRGIYEDAYGTLNIEHRQPVSSQVSPDLNASLEEKEKKELGNPFDAQCVFSPESEEILRQEIREGQYFVNDRYMDIAKIHAARTSEAPAASEIRPTDVAATPPITLYKILAYDPTMQTINTAATTSSVPDSSPTLTPAEVLLRLSNPSKFFPHFAPLQVEGYEIVSGSGDVLVFRKVRGASPVISRTADQVQTVKTNPIDGTQGTPQPATGNFASPTGFVNHDLHDQTQGRTAFVSGISMRREEPVFSGQQRAWSDASDRTTKRGAKRGRKMAKRVFLGAGILAASTYTIGVVAEFFRSGGSDGLGTVGF